MHYLECAQYLKSMLVTRLWCTICREHTSIANFANMIVSFFSFSYAIVNVKS